ncbi:MAG: glycoside hydrolase family 25 protein [Bacteroidetes bacterium]|nr:glycoside hydrolase family 25 protein [Bacteroidota bacterium]
MYGIDVSKYQRTINWYDVERDGISFAIIKATEGARIRDKNFVYNWEDCSKTSIVKGSYHFYRAHIPWTEQFENFTRQVNLSPGDLPPIVDIEYDDGVNKALIVRDLKKFLIALENHYKVRPIIYTYESFYNDYLIDKFRNYTLWIASYQYSPPILKDGAKWEFWQYSEKGSIEGIKSYVDLNCFYGNTEQLNKLRIK